MMLGRPTPADPEIASVLFEQHMNDFWASGIPDQKGLGRIRLDSLHCVVAIPAMRADGQLIRSSFAWALNFTTAFRRPLRS